MTVSNTVTQVQAGRESKKKDTSSTFHGKKCGFQPQQRYTPTQLAVLRFLCLLFMFVCYWKSDIIQDYIDTSWNYLREKWWFQTVYFETLLVVVYSFPSTLFFQLIDCIPLLDKYRIESEAGRINSEGIPALAYHSIEYILPLAILDTFHVKHYHGVSYDVIAEKKLDWIQRKRALPEEAPQFGDIITHITVAIVIYDALFFIIHYHLHKNQTLYRILHKKHHTHDVINAKATDHEHWVERMIFILSANFGLKVQGAHPFTRMIFVFVFINLLLYNHGGYDFPWALDKIVPGGVVSGSRQHYIHHAKGRRYYQFIFTYLDKSLDWWTNRQAVKKIS